MFHRDGLRSVEWEIKINLRLKSSRDDLANVKELILGIIRALLLRDGVRETLSSGFKWVAWKKEVPIGLTAE